jgi:predicted phage terminase large subunit-like protein
VRQAALAEPIPRARRVVAARSYRRFLNAYARQTFDVVGDHQYEFPGWFAHVERQLDTPGPWELDLVVSRKTAKTTLLVDWLALYKALLDPAVESILILSASDQLAQENVSVVREQLEGNQSLIEDYGDLRSPEEWAKGKCTILKPGPYDGMPLARRPKCRIRAKGAGARLRGGRGGGAHRPDVVLKDDLQRDIKDARIAQEFEEWEEAVVGEIGSVRRIEINVGNLVSYQMLALGKRLSGVPFTSIDGHRYDQHLIDEVSAKRWGHRLRMKFQAIDDRGQSIWPSNPQFTPAALAKKRAELASAIWAAEYQNDPRDPSTAVFGPGMFARELWYGPAPRDGKEARERWTGCTIYGAVDPAISKREQADETAIATVARSRDGFIYVLDVTHGRYSKSETLRMIAALWRRWEWSLLGVEVVAYQQALREDIDEMSRRTQGLDIRAYAIKTDTDKARRIGGLEPLLSNGTLRFADDHGHLRDEMMSYRPQRTHDDIPDALEMAVTLARRFRTGIGGMVEPTEEKDDENDWYRESEWLEDGTV